MTSITDHAITVSAANSSSSQCTSSLDSCRLIDNLTEDNLRILGTFERGEKPRINYTEKKLEKEDRKLFVALQRKIFGAFSPNFLEDQFKIACEARDKAIIEFHEKKKVCNEQNCQYVFHRAPKKSSQHALDKLKENINTLNEQEKAIAKLQGLITNGLTGLLAIQQTYEDELGITTLVSKKKDTIMELKRIFITYGQNVIKTTGKKNSRTGISKTAMTLNRKIQQLQKEFGNRSGANRRLPLTRPTQYSPPEINKNSQQMPQQPYTQKLNEELALKLKARLAKTATMDMGQIFRDFEMERERKVREQISNDEMSKLEKRFSLSMIDRVKELDKLAKEEEEEGWFLMDELEKRSGRTDEVTSSDKLPKNEAKPRIDTDSRGWYKRTNSESIDPGFLSFLKMRREANCDPEEEIS